MNIEPKSPEEWVRMAIDAGDQPHLIWQRDGKKYIGRRLEGQGPDNFPEEWKNEIADILVEQGRFVVG